MPTITAFTESDTKVPYATYFENVPSDEVYDLKNCPYDDKVRFMRYVMGDSGLLNAHLLSNIALLISAPELSDDVFEREDCIFNSLLEYVDMKTDLITEIKAYTEALLRYFFSAIKSYNTHLPDNKVDVPVAYASLLMILKIGDISKMMNRATVSTENLELINNAELIVNHFFITSNIVDDFVKYIIG